jgi:hypothetical protein
MRRDSEGEERRGMFALYAVMAILNTTILFAWID